MGNRADFVIVKDQDWQLYYSHWAGCRMLDALIGGPDLALRYARSLRRCDSDDWVDRFVDACDALRDGHAKTA
jgi:hypothetical protein